MNNVKNKKAKKKIKSVGFFWAFINAIKTNLGISEK